MKLRNTFHAAAFAFLPHGAYAADENSAIHTVAVVSILGDEIDMQTQGTSFDYAEYKLHTDWNLDEFIKDYVTKAVSPRFTVVNETDMTPMFAGLDRSPKYGVDWLDIRKRLRDASQKPNVDAVIVIYPESDNPTGYVSAGLAASYSTPILWQTGSTMVAATFNVGIFNAKTGEKIDDAPGRYKSSAYFSGYSPPWDNCDDTIWAGSAEKMTEDKKARIKKEFLSLITRSMPNALLKSGLIDETSEATLLASATAGDAKCGPVH